MRFDRGPVSEADRLRRRLAKKSALAERRDRHVRVLVERIRDRDERIEWTRSYFGFRVEYRLRGGIRRLRRWRRQLVWAFAHHTTSGWRW